MAGLDPNISKLLEAYPDMPISTMARAIVLAEAFSMQTGWGVSKTAYFVDGFLALLQGVDAPKAEAPSHD